MADASDQTPEIATGEVASLDTPETVYDKILALLHARQPAEAERMCWYEIQRTLSRESRLWFLLGVSAQLQAKHEAALAAFRHAYTLDSADVQIMQALAATLQHLGQAEEAYRFLTLANAQAPDNVAVLVNLAILTETLQQPRAAADLYRRILTLSPANETALLNLGALLLAMGQRISGLQDCRQAHALCPQSATILFNLVDALQLNFCYEEALAYCEAGLAWQPQHAGFWFKKGMLLACLQQFDEAQTALAEAQVLDPDIMLQSMPQLRAWPEHMVPYASASRMYLDAMYQEQKRCYWQHREEYLHAFHAMIAQAPDASEADGDREHAFEVIALPVAAPQRLRLMRKISMRVRELAWMLGLPPFDFSHLQSAPEQWPLRKLRIGYLSPNFRQHPTVMLSKKLYALHDRSRFEVYGYAIKCSPQNTTTDRFTRAVANGCDVFRPLAGLAIADIARLIHADQIDILVDLSGFSGEGYPEILALRPAPLQVTYLGLACTAGADFVDYTLLDTTVVQPDEAELYDEAVIRLPHCHYIYDTDMPNQPTRMHRKKYKLPEKAFVFCAINNAYKIEPEMFAVWMEILHAVPGSVLWLLAEQEDITRNLQLGATRHGVDANRLVFAKWLPVEEHIQRLQLADLFLDTRWHNAHTTGMEALWQGLPMISCYGSVHSARIASAMLYALELPELVARDLAEYRQKAIFYASQPEALQVIRQKLHANRHTAPLFDIAGSVKYMEWAYQQIWQRYQCGEAATGLDVPDLRSTQSQTHGAMS